MSEFTPEQTEIAVLKTKADNLGIIYHANHGPAKLKELISEAEALQANEDDIEEEDEGLEAVVETRIEATIRLRKEAKRLIRCNISPMDPALKDHNGIFVSVSNGVLGTISKYVDFNTVDGYHIPHVLYEEMLNAKCQVFVSVPDPRTGKKKKEGRLIKRYSIDVLPQLTKEQLAALKAEQKARNSID
jgi:hypothetical protein